MFISYNQRTFHRFLWCIVIEPRASLMSAAPKIAATGIVDVISAVAIIFHSSNRHDDVIMSIATVTC
jgi:hypothetical protein